MQQVRDTSAATCSGHAGCRALLPNSKKSSRDSDGEGAKAENSDLQVRKTSAVQDRDSDLLDAVLSSVEADDSDTEAASSGSVASDLERQYRCCPLTRFFRYTPQNDGIEDAQCYTEKLVLHI